MELILFLVLLIPISLLAWLTDKKNDDLFDDLSDDDF